MLNMLEAARQKGVKKFVYASSSSVYGDEAHLPKQEGVEGNLLSPYALTKRCDEEWAKQYTMHYGLDTYGLRYFNVFGRRQDPNGAYAAVIPLWVKALIHHESPFINGDGSYSRDFTYIDNVIQANELAAMVSHDEIVKRASLYNMNLPQSAPIDLVFNVAYGGNTTLNELFDCLRNNLAKFDADIMQVKPIYRDNRAGDIPHSQASIIKAQRILGYHPKYSAIQGFEEACDWYWDNLK
jgi:UDP-N-acetylglucosamine 4-epimerase